MSLSPKYWGLPEDPAGMPLSWPGTSEGFPVRGSVPQMTKSDEYEDIGHDYDFHSRILTLNDAEQMREYELIKDKIANGLWLQLFEKVQSTDDGKFMVMISWAEVYGVLESKGSIPIRAVGQSVLNKPSPPPEKSQYVG